MTFTKVGQSSEGSVAAGSTGNVSYTPVGTGNLMVVWVYCTSTSSTTFTANDGGTNTYSNDKSQISGTARTAVLLSAVTTTSGAALTINVVTVSGTATYRFVVIEYHSDTAGTWGIDNSGSIDEAATNSHVTTSPAVATASAPTVCCCCSALNNTATTRTAGSTQNSTAYTSTGTANTQSFGQWAIETATLSAETGAWTATGTARSSAGVFVAYKLTATASAKPWFMHASERLIGHGVA